MKPWTLLTTLLLSCCAATHSYAQEFCKIVEQDFNSDGIPDLAIDQNTFCGNAGCWWDIYLQKDSETYITQPLSIFFHPLAVHFENRNGKVVITTYNRSSGSEGSLTEQVFKDNDFVTLSIKTIHPSDSGTLEDQKLYESLFGNLRRKPIAKRLSLEECEKLLKKVAPDKDSL